MNGYIHIQLTRHFKSIINQQISDIKRRQTIHEKMLLCLKGIEFNCATKNTLLFSTPEKIKECKNIISLSKNHINKLLYIKKILYYSSSQRVCVCLTERYYAKMTKFELSLYLIMGNAWIGKPKLKNKFLTKTNPNINLELNIS